MSLLQKPLFRAAAWLFLGLAILSFCARVVYVVLFGNALETYSTAKGIEVPYVVAFVVVLAAGATLVAAGAAQLWHQLQLRRLKRLGS